MLSIKGLMLVLGLFSAVLAIGVASGMYMFFHYENVQAQSISRMDSEARKRQLVNIPHFERNPLEYGR